MRAHERPSKIGRFVIEETLGYGASGAVYRGFDPILHRRVAIKMLRVDLLRHEGWAQTFIDRFYNEARLVGTLSHPNIVTLFDAGETDDQTPFLAMEYADGETVAARLENTGTFSPSEALPLLSQMASALDYAHGKGVLHRDIKPSNLILHQGTQVKITDFGIAQLVSLEPDPGTLPPGKLSRLTSQGVLLGSPSYMSPEQAQGEPLDSRTDVFSLGVVAFEMLSQQLPFEGSTVTATLYKLIHREPLKPALLAELGLDGRLWDEIFNKVLAKHPENRYPTAAAFVDALQPLLEPGGSTTARLLRASPTLTPALTEPHETGTIPFQGRASLSLAAPAAAPPTTAPVRSAHNLWWAVAGVSVVLCLLVVTGVLRWLRSLEITPPPVAHVTSVPEPARPTPAPSPTRKRSRHPRVPRAHGSEAQVADYIPPRRTQWQAVRYPDGPRFRRMAGSVEVSFLITPSGIVDDVVVDVSTGSELDQAVVEAVRNWKYVPARRNGVPIPVREHYRHEFRTGT